MPTSVPDYLPGIRRPISTQKCSSASLSAQLPPPDSLSRLVPQSPSDQLLAERMPVRLTNTAHPAFGFYSTGISWFSHLSDPATLGQRPFSPSAEASLGDLPSLITLNMFQEADSFYYQPTVNLLQEQLWSAFKSQGGVLSAFSVGGDTQQYLSIQGLLWNLVTGLACGREGARL